MAHEFLSEFGFRRQLQSHEGGEFNNLLLLALFEAANVGQCMSSFYHLSSQGSGQRFDGTMKTYLLRFLEPEKKLAKTWS